MASGNGTASRRVPVSSSNSRSAASAGASSASIIPLGIIYAPNALFFLAFAAILVLLLHFSIAVSRLADQSKVLAQRVAMLDERLRRTEARAEEAEEEPAREPVASQR